MPRWRPFAPDANGVRVVLDTNVLVSGLLWRGLPHELIRQARAGRITIVSSSGLLVELGQSSAVENSGRH
jgi:putative PIN family toxin of toxin-antitoxin system